MLLLFDTLEANMIVFEREKNTLLGMNLLNLAKKKILSLCPKHTGVGYGGDAPTRAISIACRKNMDSLIHDLV